MGKNIYTQVSQVAVALTVIASAWFALEVGLGEVYAAITDPTSVSAATNQAYGGSVDFIERIGTFCLALVALGTSGAGMLSIQRGNPQIVNTALRYSMPIAGLICAVTMTDTLTEFIQGDRVWANFTDAENSWVLAMCSAAVAGVANILRNR